MFGNNQYWWLGLLMFLIFVGLNVIVFLLRKNPSLSYAVSYTIALYLLIFKTVEYTVYQIMGDHLNLPVEFSTISYFVFGIAVVFKLKKIDQFPVFTAILAGMIYGLAFWVSPDSYIIDKISTFDLVMAAINHYSMYFAGMLMLANCRKYSPKYVWQFAIGVGLFVGYSYLIYLCTPYMQRPNAKIPIIIQITDCSILNWLSKDLVIVPWMKAVYYVCCGFALCTFFACYYLLNRICMKKRVKAGLPEEYYARNWRLTYNI